MANKLQEITLYCFKQKSLDNSSTTSLEFITCLKVKSKCFTVMDMLESINSQLVGTSEKFPSTFYAYLMRLFDLHSKRKFKKKLSNNSPLLSECSYAIIFYCTLTNFNKFLFIHPLSYTLALNIHKNDVFSSFAQELNLPDQSSTMNFYKIIPDGFLCIYESDAVDEIIRPNDQIIPSLQMSIVNLQTGESFVVIGPFYGNLDEFLASDEKSYILKLKPHYFDSQGNQLDRIPNSSDNLLDVFMFKICYCCE